jgi:signal transduction histidine kinase
VPDDAVRPLYLVAAEAVHNAVRHAQAGVVEILLAESAPDAVTLTVHDDGRGFDPDRVAGGVGLTTMREHAAEAGAHFSLATGGAGTTIELRVPLTASAVPVPTLETTA